MRGIYINIAQVERKKRKGKRDPKNSFIRIRYFRSNISWNIFSRGWIEGKVLRKVFILFIIDKFLSYAFKEF